MLQAIIPHAETHSACNSELCTAAAEVTAQQCEFGSSLAHALQVDFCAARNILGLYAAVHFVPPQ